MKTVRQNICEFVWLLVAVFALAGCQSAPTPAISSGLDLNDPLFASDTLSGGQTKQGVVFKPEDSIGITFIGPEGAVMPPVEGRVSEDGFVTLPLLSEPVKVAGKTAAEVQRDVHNAYVPKYYLRLTVTVRGQDRVYYVGGEVKAPSRQAWVGEITLTKAIQTAGDFTDWANKKKVRITRLDGSTVGPINCVKILEGKTPDVPVYSGDKIYVPRRGF